MERPTATSSGAARRQVRLLAGISAALIVCLVLAGCNPPDTPLQRAGGNCVVGVVGDSLTVGARDSGGLVQRFAARGCAVTAIDARTSRPSTEGAAIVESWAASDRLPAILVVALGTNECSAPSFIPSARRILAAAGPNRPVVWVNTWRPGCDTAVNDSLFALQNELTAARADGGNLWILNHWSWIFDARWALARDGIHLNPSGYAAYADRIVTAVAG